jgi:hypothetical protein
VNSFVDFSVLSAAQCLEEEEFVAGEEFCCVFFAGEAERKKIF